MITPAVLGSTRHRMEFQHESNCRISILEDIPVDGCQLELWSLQRNVFFAQNEVCLARPRIVAKFLIDTGVLQ
jgi:hypothetical protein